ncbi:hypothetical protein L218DRAFT_965483 [Marasmius fiardii PR-910]|nr:hypothetical protein L218DRAFT_965483 [Marasmius fiardii PR-910]
MQPTTSTTIAHHPSHTTRAQAALTLHNAVAADELNQIVNRHETRRGYSIMGKSAYEAHDRASKAMSWTSKTTTTTTTVNIPLSVLPFKESHSNSNVTTTTTTASTLGPPPLNRQECIRLPSQCDNKTGVILHPLLSHPKRAGIDWNLVESYGMIESVIDERGWHPLKDLATDPALPSMSVVHPWLPWTITVHASNMDSRGTTVADVLMVISKDLMTPIDRTGRTRVSYLRRKWIFVGLKISEVGGDIWELVVRWLYLYF